MLTTCNFQNKSNNPQSIQDARKWLKDGDYTNDGNGIYVKSSDSKELGDCVAIITCEGLIIHTYAKLLNY